MKTYLVQEIPAGSFFSAPVFIDNQFVVTAPEMPFSEEIIKALKTWDFKEVKSNGESGDSYVGEEGLVEKWIELSDNDRIQRAEEFYQEFHEYVEDLFTHITIASALDFKSVAAKIKSVCEIVREDRRFLLRIQKYSEAGLSQNYLASHAVKSTIISLIIGFYLKLPPHRLIELGVAALLHEVGMLKLPSQTYLSSRALSPQERKAILTHPILGFNALKAFDFPLTISLAALEHHERENGSGYPQKLTGDKISLYAKIIAVACSYEALTTNRPHKTAKDSHTSMLDLLKNEGKQYDETVIRALVFSLSIYPIGLYVLLSSGQKGQVVDINPENPRFPIVQIFGEPSVDGKNRTVNTSPEGVTIVRPLTREETGT
ncbi:MAG: HD-GYP domain-containing protein [Treponema sp.]|jgi:HD-GYP domain-containing protein (c-di-GMP phosphodiesterase class II)|nr:HD-GYP domain-containing protein [Treponema sp.]